MGIGGEGFVAVVAHAVEVEADVAAAACAVVSAAGGGWGVERGEGAGEPCQSAGFRFGGGFVARVGIVGAGGGAVGVFTSDEGVYGIASAAEAA